MKIAMVLMVFVAGVAAGAVLNAVGADPAPPPAPAFLVVAGETLDAAGMGPYREAAGPGARAAGMEMLGRGDASSMHLLEGSWPYPGFVAVEKYRSMEALLGFWNSEAYQAARKLREGKVKLHFVVAVDGVGGVSP